MTKIGKRDFQRMKENEIFTDRKRISQKKRKIESERDEDEIPE